MPQKPPSTLFELNEHGDWIFLVRFPEFKAFNAAALKEFEQAQKQAGGDQTATYSAENQLTVQSNSSYEIDHEESEESDEDQEIADEIALQERLFELGLFQVTAEGPEPTPSQIRTCQSLVGRTREVFRILIDHTFQYYNEHLDEFRDFFNGDPADRDRLLPKITSTDGLKRLMRLIEIDIHENARNGQALVTFSFDTTWDADEYWDITLCGDQIVTPDFAPFPFQLPKSLGWEKLPVTRQGLRFAEFNYRGLWTGTFTIDPTGVCQRQIRCPVCDGLDLEDPELIDAIRDAAPSHMLATLVHKLKLELWIRRGLMVVAPISFGLGWFWNPLFYWGTITIAVVSALAAYLDAGWRRSGWTILAMLEVGAAGLALLPKRQPTTLDTVPDWTWVGFFEQFVWMTSAAIAAVWLYFLIGMARHPILRHVFWNLAAFGLILVSAVVFVAVTDYSALHLLWFIPLSLLITTVLTARQLRRALEKTIENTIRTGTDGLGLHATWTEMLQNMERGRRSNSVYESRPGSNRNKTETDD